MAYVRQLTKLGIYVCWQHYGIIARNNWARKTVFAG
jgi:hypothetical protein